MYNLYDELTKEQENDIIEKLAHKIIDMQIDFHAILLLEMVKPFSFVGSQLGLVSAPYLMLFGRENEEMGLKYLRLFEKRENVERIVQRVKTLKEEKEAQAEVQQEKMEEPKSIWAKIIQKLI